MPGPTRRRPPKRRPPRERDRTGTLSRRVHPRRGHPAWSTPALVDARAQEALAHFAQAGFPTLRQEDWKYTSVAALERSRFAVAPQHPDDGLTAAVGVQSETLALPDTHLLVFVNGRHPAAMVAPRCPALRRDAHQSRRPRWSANQSASKTCICRRRAQLSVWLRGVARGVHGRRCLHPLGRRCCARRADSPAVPCHRARLGNTSVQCRDCGRSGAALRSSSTTSAPTV